MRTVPVVIFVLALAVLGPQPADGQQNATTRESEAADSDYRQKLGYMLGLNIGNDLRQSQIECDLPSLFDGIRDAVEGGELKWSQEELQAAGQRFQQQMQQQAATQMQQAQQAAEENQQQAREFLAANKQRDGVQTTVSGLQYKVLEQGSGPSPTTADTVRCHYRGTLLDGTEFDSSYGGQPAEFPVQGVIAGWTEALQKMHVGDKWQLFVPPALAYGMEPPGPPIEPNSLLVFEVELVDIVD